MLYWIILNLTHEPDLVSEVDIGDRFSSSDHNMITFKSHHSSTCAVKKL